MYADVRCHQDRVHTLIGAPLGRLCRILWAGGLQRRQWEEGIINNCWKEERCEQIVVTRYRAG